MTQRQSHAVSPSLSADELTAAAALARTIAIRFRTVRTDELEREECAANTPG